MKRRMIMWAMVLVMMIVSIGGCFIDEHHGRDRGHDMDVGHDRDGGHDRQDRHEDRD